MIWKGKDYRFEQIPGVPCDSFADASGLARGEDCPPSILDILGFPCSKIGAETDNSPDTQEVQMTVDGTVAGLGNKAHAIDRLLPRQFEQGV